MDKIQSDKYLSQEEVEKLEEGDKIEVTWSGGNGPHEYFVIKHNGLSYAAASRWKDKERMIVHRLEFVGTKKPHTLVKRLKD